MKTYVITLSKVFPASHMRKGEPTEFLEKFLNGQTGTGDFKKLHTIRANCPLWEKRIKEVQQGYAVLSVRQWSGRPYASKQVTIANLTAVDGVGIQRLSFDTDRDGCISYKFFDIGGRYADINDVANNDGLTFDDWREWFKNYDHTKPLAIIHFTSFRY